jgi:broad specificity phosphatase PhoE
MPTQILLIRHGETLWNRDQRIQGQKDVPLSSAGEDQARRLARRLEPLPLIAAYSSDSARALRTAQIVIGGRGLSIETSASLRERNFGAWEGLLWTEIQTKFPAQAARFHEDSVHFTAEGGETWNQMQERVFRKITEIVDRHSDGTVAVFTHGGPCKAAIMAALGLPPVQWRVWVASNASVHRLIHEGKSGRRLWKLGGFNDVAHLEESEMFADPSAAHLADQRPEA